jgi:hypothetical protein
VGSVLWGLEGVGEGVPIRELGSRVDGVVDDVCGGVQNDGGGGSVAGKNRRVVGRPDGFGGGFLVVVGREEDGPGITGEVRQRQVERPGFDVADSFVMGGGREEQRGNSAGQVRETGKLGDGSCSGNRDGVMGVIGDCRSEDHPGLGRIVELVSLAEPD